MTNVSRLASDRLHSYSTLSQTHFNGASSTIMRSFHYLDDFFFAGPPHSDDCSWAITSFLALCSQLGVPLKQEKLVLPSTKMTFLGINLDAETQIASIPQDKLDALLTSLRLHLKFYRDRTPVTKRALLSLIGKLSFATKVIPAGRIFLRRLLDTAHSITDLDTPLHLSWESALDINWWLTFASTWNGTAFFLELAWSHSPDMCLYTDASSEIGYGAFWKGHWIQARWPPALQPHSIQWKELYAACEVWGHLWPNKRILFYCDNIWQLSTSGGPACPKLHFSCTWSGRCFLWPTFMFPLPTSQALIIPSLMLCSASFHLLAPEADEAPTLTPDQLTYHSAL